jgi:hypothetical protein
LQDAPLIECRVAYRAHGNSDRRAQRAAFAEVLASRLRLLVPHMFRLAGSDVALSDRNFRVWTERVLQGGEHRPEMLVELFTQPGEDRFDALSGMLARMLGPIVWAEMLHADEQVWRTGFFWVTAQTRFSRTTQLVVDIDSGGVRKSHEGGWPVGSMFKLDDPVISTVRSNIPQ